MSGKEFFSNIRGTAVLFPPDILTQAITHPDDKGFLAIFTGDQESLAARTYVRL